MISSSVNRANRRVHNALRCCSLLAATPSSTPSKEAATFAAAHIFMEVDILAHTSPSNSNGGCPRISDQITSGEECLIRSRMVSRGKRRGSPVAGGLTSRLGDCQSGVDVYIVPVTPFVSMKSKNASMFLDSDGNGSPAFMDFTHLLVNEKDNYIRT